MKKDKETIKHLKKLEKDIGKMYPPEEIKLLPTPNLELTKSNVLISGFEKGEMFFKAAKDLGRWILMLCFLVTSFWFWVTYALDNINNPDLLQLAAMMLNVLRLGVFLFVGGYLLYMICYFILERLHKKELNVFYKEGKKDEDIR